MSTNKEKRGLLNSLLIPLVIIFTLSLTIFSFIFIIPKAEAQIQLTVTLGDGTTYTGTSVPCDNGNSSVISDPTGENPDFRTPCTDLTCPTDSDPDPQPEDDPTPPCSTSSCTSAPNICGDFGSGTKCTGGTGSYSCTAQKPADPSGTCSVSTACGVAATGFNGCGSGCNITNYPVCELIPDPECTDPSGCPLIINGDIDWVTLTGGVTNIAANIYASPSIVKRETKSKIIWLSQETDSCEVTGTNGDILGTSAIYGEEMSSNLITETTYTVSCTGYDGSEVEDSVTVKILPIWQEI